MSEFDEYKNYTRRMILTSKIEWYIFLAMIISLIVSFYFYYNFGNLYGISNIFAIIFIITFLSGIAISITLIPIRFYWSKNINFELVIIALLRDLSNIQKCENYQYKMDLFFVLDKLKSSNYSFKNFHRKMLFSKSGYRKLSGNLVNLRNKSIKNLEDFLKNDIIFLNKQQRKGFLDKLVINIQKSNRSDIIDFVNQTRIKYKTRDKISGITPSKLSKIGSISDKGLNYLNARFRAFILIIIVVVIVFLIASGKIDLLVSLLANTIR